MAISNTNVFEFTSIDRVLEFVKPLMIEGYNIVTNTVFREFPEENRIDHYVVSVGCKGKSLKVMEIDEDEN